MPKLIEDKRILNEKIGFTENIFNDFDYENAINERRNILINEINILNDLINELLEVLF